MDKVFDNSKELNSYVKRLVGQIKQNIPVVMAKSIADKIERDTGKRPNIKVSKMETVIEHNDVIKDRDALVSGIKSHVSNNIGEIVEKSIP